MIVAQSRLKNGCRIDVLYGEGDWVWVAYRPIASGYTRLRPYEVAPRVAKAANALCAAVRASSAV